MEKLLATAKSSRRTQLDQLRKALEAEEVASRLKLSLRKTDGTFELPTTVTPRKKLKK